MPRLRVPRLELRPAWRGSADPGGARPVHPESRSRGALRDDRGRRASSGSCSSPGRAGGRTPRPTIPCPRRIPWWEQPGFRTIPIETYDWACSAARRVENFVDFSHFPWVHPGVLGDRSKPLSPEHEIIDDGATISFDIALEEPQASVKGDVAPGAKVQRDPTTYTLHLPLSVTLDQRLPPSPDRPDGNHFILFLAVAPLSARTLPLVHLERADVPPRSRDDAELAAFQALILDQDRPIAESQRPEELPVDLSQELHIAGPDKASIAYRRRLAELAATADEPLLR